MITGNPEIFMRASMMFECWVSPVPPTLQFATTTELLFPAVKLVLEFCQSSERHQSETMRLTNL
jgi:hypothetical protein